MSSKYILGEILFLFTRILIYLKIKKREKIQNHFLTKGKENIIGIPV